MTNSTQTVEAVDLSAFRALVAVFLLAASWAATATGLLPRELEAHLLPAAVLVFGGAAAMLLGVSR